jgi:multisubunit Na+/H+ antiporter MnhB subunit
MDRFRLFVLEATVSIGAITAIAVRLIQLTVERIRGRGFSRRAGWPATLVWTLGCALAAFAAVGAMSIGIFVLPFAVIACGVAAWLYHALPEGAIGASLGTGIVLCVLGLMNHPFVPCVGGFQVISARHISGCDGTSWFPLGLALIIVAAASQAMLERQKTPPRMPTSLLPTRHD